MNLIIAAAVEDFFRQGLPLTGTPFGAPVLAGDTWYFQLWYRDAGGTSNFTSGVALEF